MCFFLFIEIEVMNEQLIFPWRVNNLSAGHHMTTGGMRWYVSSSNNLLLFLFKLQSLRKIPQCAVKNLQILFLCLWWCRICFLVKLMIMLRNVLCIYFVCSFAIRERERLIFDLYKFLLLSTSRCVCSLSASFSRISFDFIVTRPVFLSA